MRINMSLGIELGICVAQLVARVRTKKDFVVNLQAFIHVDKLSYVMLSSFDVNQ